MKVKLVDSLVDGNKLSKEGERVFSQIKHNKLLINGNEETIVPIFAGLCQSLLSLLLDKGYVEYNEKQDYPLKRFCEKFCELGIFDKVKTQGEDATVGHGAAAALEVLAPLQKKLAKPAEKITEDELLTKPAKISDTTLAEIDALLQKLSNSTGSLRAAIVQIGEVQKKYETKDVMNACRMTRFFIENTKADNPPPIESRTIRAQCFNFHRTIIEMNLGIKEHSSAIKKNQINKAVLLTKSEDSKITFMMDLKKPDYVFMLETPILVGRGLIFLEMEQTMENILKLL